MHRNSDTSKHVFIDVSN